MAVMESHCTLIKHNIGLACLHDCTKNCGSPVISVVYILFLFSQFPRFMLMCTYVDVYFQIPLLFFPKYLKTFKTILSKLATTMH